MKNFAIPLYALVDAKKVDLQSPQLDDFAEQLQVYFATELAISFLDARIEILGAIPYMIFNAVEQESVPRLCALVDVQKTQLFRYQREDEEQATLTPLMVKPE